MRCQSLFQLSISRRECILGILSHSSCYRLCTSSHSATELDCVVVHYWYFLWPDNDFYHTGCPNMDEGTLAPPYFASEFLSLNWFYVAHGFRPRYCIEIFDKDLLPYLCYDSRRAWSCRSLWWWDFFQAPDTSSCNWKELKKVGMHVVARPKRRYDFIEDI